MTLTDFLDTTRRRNVDVFPALAVAYESLYERMIAGSSSHISDALPKLTVVNTLNKRTELVPLRGELHLVHDQYLGQTLNELSRLYFSAKAPSDAHALTYRLLSEAASCAGADELASYYAYVYSVMHHESRGYLDDEDEETAARRQISVHVQEAYVIAHELAHLHWSKSSFDPMAIDMLLDSLMDGDPPGDLDQMVETYLDDLSFQYHGKAVPHVDNIKTDEDRANDVKARAQVRADFIRQGEERAARTAALKVEPRVREEIFADWMAAQSCLAHFGDEIEDTDLIVAIHLAMENLTTIALVTEFSLDRIEDAQTRHSEVVAVRKRALRQSLDFWMQKRRPDTPHLGFQVLTTANQRYMHYVRDPISMDALTRVQTKPRLDGVQLAKLRSQLTAAVPQASDPQFIIRKRPFKNPAQ